MTDVNFDAESRNENGQPASYVADSLKVIAVLGMVIGVGLIAYGFVIMNSGPDIIGFLVAGYGLSAFVGGFMLWAFGHLIQVNETTAWQGKELLDYIRGQDNDRTRR